MRIEKEEKQGKIIEIAEDVKIPGTKIILEAGDKIEVFEADEEDDEEMDDEDKDDKDDDKKDDDDDEMDEKKKK